MLYARGRLLAVTKKKITVFIIKELIYVLVIVGRR